jgi:uncharacterized protein (TIGR02246 family)
MNDEQAIGDLWRTMAEGWENGDAAKFASVFGEHVDFVTVRGQEMVGRSQVEAGHKALFDSVYEKTRLVADVRLIRPITKDHCLVHVTSTILPVGLSTHAQAVVTRQDGAWSITAFHNMIPLV